MIDDRVMQNVSQPSATMRREDEGLLDFPGFPAWLSCEVVPAVDVEDAVVTHICDDVKQCIGPPHLIDVRPLDVNVQVLAKLPFDVLHERLPELLEDWGICDEHLPFLDRTGSCHQFGLQIEKAPTESALTR